MNDKERITRVWYAAIDGIDKPEMLINLTQKQCTRIGSEAAAVEISLDFFCFLDLKRAVVACYSLSYKWPFF
jgi:hypothetical protein